MSPVRTTSWATSRTLRLLSMLAFYKSSNALASLTRRSIMIMPIAAPIVGAVSRAASRCAACSVLISPSACSSAMSCW